MSTSEPFFQLDLNSLQSSPPEPITPVGPLESGVFVENTEELTNTDKEILAFIQQKYMVTGSRPSAELVIKALGITTGEYLSACRKDKFQGALIRLRLSEEKPSEALLPEQVMAINAILNPFDKTSVRDKLKALDISTQKYNAWKAQPAFQKYMKERAEALFSQAAPDAYLAVVKGVQSNDLQFTKLYLEMSNLYNPKVQVEVNIQMVLTRVVEILTKHVPGDILLTISEELEALVPQQLQIGA